MAIATTSVSVAREPRLLGQTVVVIGGSVGIGFETARLASSEGAEVVLAARDTKRLEQAAPDLSARSSVALDADDAVGIKRFSASCPRRSTTCSSRHTRAGRRTGPCSTAPPRRWARPSPGA